MDSTIKIFVFILLLSFNISSGSRVKVFRELGENPVTSSSEAIVEMKMREMIGVDAMLDYDKPMPNPRHEKRPGGN